MSDDLDVGAAYRRGREDVATLVRSLGSEQLNAPVPACPGWRVHDVVSHLTGVATDALASGLQGMPTVEQTAAQVERRAGEPTSIVLREWERAALQFEMMLTKNGRSVVATAVDVAVHEQDIRGALSLPGNRDAPLVELAVEWAIELWFNKIDSAGLSEVAIHDESSELIAGRVDAEVVFRSSRFELFRAAYGRRSSEQIQRRLSNAGDPAAYVPLLCVFGPAAQDLIE